VDWAPRDLEQGLDSYESDRSQARDVNDSLGV